jgi:hypothetical protein
VQGAGAGVTVLYQPPFTPLGSGSNPYERQNYHFAARGTGRLVVHSLTITLTPFYTSMDISAKLNQPAGRIGFQYQSTLGGVAIGDGGGFGAATSPSFLGTGLVFDRMIAEESASAIRAIMSTGTATLDCV